MPRALEKSLSLPACPERCGSGFRPGSKEEGRRQASHRGNRVGGENPARCGAQVTAPQPSLPRGGRKKMPRCNLWALGAAGEGAGRASERQGGTEGARAVTWDPRLLAARPVRRRQLPGAPARGSNPAARRDVGRASPRLTWPDSPGPAPRRGGAGHSDAGPCVSASPGTARLRVPPPPPEARPVPGRP